MSRAPPGVCGRTRVSALARPALSPPPLHCAPSIIRARLPATPIVVFRNAGKLIATRPMLNMGERRAGLYIIALGRIFFRRPVLASSFKSWSFGRPNFENTILARVFRVRCTYHRHILQGIEATWRLQRSRRDVARCNESKSRGTM